MRLRFLRWGWVALFSGGCRGSFSGWTRLGAIGGDWGFLSGILAGWFRWGLFVRLLIVRLSRLLGACSRMGWILEVRIYCFCWMLIRVFIRFFLIFHFFIIFYKVLFRKTIRICCLTHWTYFIIWCIFGLVIYFRPSRLRFISLNSSSRYPNYVINVYP